MRIGFNDGPNLTVRNSGYSYYRRNDNGNVPAFASTASQALNKWRLVRPYVVGMQTTGKYNTEPYDLVIR